MYIIGLDARPLSTRMSGVGRLIAETIRAFPNKDKYKFLLFTNREIHPNHQSILELPNVKLYLGTGILSKKGAIYFNLYLPYQLRKLKLDLFWGSQQVLPPFLPRNLPAILTYCDLVLYLFPSTMRLLALIQQRMFQEHSVKRASYIITISKQTQQDLIRQFNYSPEKTKVAYPGVYKNEIDHLLKKSPSERVASIDFFYILSVSTIEPRKNYPFLLSVYREYRKLNPDFRWKWIIAGKIGWESPKFLAELMDDIETHKDIVLIDDASDVDLHHLYQKTSLFLFASKYEGFGIPLLEAIAHQRLALVSDIFVFRETGKDKVHYLPLDSPKSWAEKIIELKNCPHPDYSDVELFTWQKSAQITESVMRKFLK